MKIIIYIHVCRCPAREGAREGFPCPKISRVIVGISSYFTSLDIANAFGILAKKGVFCHDFTTFWVMLLIGVNPGRVSM